MMNYYKPYGYIKIEKKWFKKKNWWDILLSLEPCPLGKGIILIQLHLVELNLI